MSSANTTWHPTILKNAVNSLTGTWTRDFALTWSLVLEWVLMERPVN